MLGKQSSEIAKHETVSISMSEMSALKIGVANSFAFLTGTGHVTDVFA
jgi:hypothetical protein